MGGYATKTEVSVEKSISEIRGTLTRYGANGFAFAEGDGEPHSGCPRCGGENAVGVELRDRKGADMAEWPPDLCVREMPKAGTERRSDGATKGEES